TRGYDLKAPWIIHTVGPIWRDGKKKEEELLASCYRKCMTIAEDIGVKSIAFPAISTGVYGFPAEKASQIALRETLHFLKDHSLPERVIFICFDSATYKIYLDLIQHREGFLI
ncbi:MAG: macro domain-containing protein, partial [Acidobacteriota bacterium]